MNRSLIAVAALILGFSPAAWAQSNAMLAERIAEARAETQKKTINYSWTNRTEIKVKGEVRSTTTELVRYDIDGKVQTTPISQDKAKGPKGIRGKVAKKKGGEMQEWMAGLARALRPYSLSTSGQLLDYLNKAAIAPDGEGKKLYAEGVVKPGDSMTMWLDADAGLTRTEVMTEHDGAGVQLTTDHATTPDGLDYVARTVIEVPEKNVEMTVENFSYQVER